MKFTFALFVSVAVAAALPQHQHGKAAAGSKAASESSAPASTAGNKYTAGKNQCEYSGFESFNMQHNHDINHGKIKMGSSISTGAPQIGKDDVKGCSPAWAWKNCDATDATRLKVTSGGCV